MNCNKPDRHVPKLICGHPLPCPFHTITIDLTEGDKDDCMVYKVNNIRQILRNTRFKF